MLNQKDEHFMKISASEVAMIDSVSGAPLVKLSTTAGGCFGQSVLVGKRREAKHVAFTPCEVWSIAKEDLRELFTAYPKAARLICQQVLGDYVRFDRLRLLSVKMAIALEPTRSKRTLLRCALQWKEQTNINLMVHDNLYQVGTPIRLSRGLCIVNPLPRVLIRATPNAPLPFLTHPPRTIHHLLLTVMLLWSPSDLTPYRVTTSCL